MLSPEDRAAIMDLYARYRHATDSRDGEAWAELFTSDGVMTPGVGTRAGVEHRGREQLADLAANQSDAPCRHWVQHPVLTQCEGYVEGICYGMVVDVAGNRPFIRSHSVYTDELVKMDGEWKFRARRSKGDIDLTDR